MSDTGIGSLYEVKGKATSRERFDAIAAGQRLRGTIVWSVPCDGCKTVIHATGLGLRKAKWTRTWVSTPGTGTQMQSDFCPDCTKTRLGKVPAGFKTSTTTTTNET